MWTSRKEESNKKGGSFMEGTVSINLFVSDTAKALVFYQGIFGAQLQSLNLEAAPGMRNAKFTIGTQAFALADENPEWGSKSPLTLGGAPLCLQLNVSAIQPILDKALEKGATIMAPGTDDAPIFMINESFRVCNIRDPFGFVWSLTD